jgi:hypothetical protein
VNCILRAIGTAFDADGFLKDSPLAGAGAAAFHRGEPKVPGAAEGPQRRASGFNVPVSGAGSDDLDAQIEDATRFLEEHEDELRRLGRFPGVEEVCLDFAIPRREVAAQSDVFPADLLWRAGALDIDLVVTHYAVAAPPDAAPTRYQ